MTSSDGFEMTKEEIIEWRDQPEYLTCCEDENCTECDGENMKVNPEHPVHQI
jgi:hypothetical protein